MYEEKKKSYTLKDLAIQILFIVLFVLILLWLFPTKKNMKKYVDKNGNTSGEPTENGGNGNSNNNNGNSNNGNENGNNGNNNNGSNSKEKLYEYKKETNSSYSDWGSFSEWSTNYVAASDTVDVQTEVRNVQVGTNVVKNQVGTQLVDAVIGTSVNNHAIVGYKTEKAVVGYDKEQVVIGTIQVQVGTEKKKVKEKVQVGTAEKFLMTKSGKSIPENKDGLVYKEVKKVMNNGSLTYIYDVYEIVPVYDVIEKEVEEPKYETQNVYEEKRTPIYGTIKTPIYGKKEEELMGQKEEAIYEETEEAVYENVTYYRYRTREKTKGNVDVKYSSKKNDEELIKQGYKYTGNVKNA